MPEPDSSPSPLPRSVEALLAESKRLRAEADRLEKLAAKLREAIQNRAKETR